MITKKLVTTNDYQNFGHDNDYQKIGHDKWLPKNWSFIVVTKKLVNDLLKFWSLVDYQFFGRWEIGNWISWNVYVVSIYAKSNF